MAARKVEALEEKMEQLKAGMEEKHSGLEGRLTSMEKRMKNLEEMMKKFVAKRSKAEPKGKGVRLESDDVESVYPYVHSSRGANEGAMGLNGGRASWRHGGYEGGEEHSHLHMAEVSPNSVGELTPNPTIKVTGQIREQPVVVLVDSGAAHNFISNRVVGRLGLKLEEMEEFRVMTVAGKMVRSQGICRGVGMMVQGVHFLPLDLGSIDVILGMK